MNIETSNYRIDILDYLRGFALIGILMINITNLLNLKPPVSNSMDEYYQRFLYLFVEGHFGSVAKFSLLSKTLQQNQI